MTRFFIIGILFLSTSHAICSDPILPDLTEVGIIFDVPTDESDLD